jgi:hypothetical protein
MRVAPSLQELGLGLNRGLPWEHLRSKVAVLLRFEPLMHERRLIGGLFILKTKEMGGGAQVVVKG